MSRLRLISCAMLVMALAYLAYRPGLASGFVFDDAANLPALGAEGPVRDAGSFLRYITSGKADPTGRPVAMLTFLLDARDWPAAPRPFKRTNLALHLLNALLLLSLLRAMGTALSIEPRRRDFAAVLGATMWALHPLFASTVLYIVQREAMLPATFTLLAAHAWLRGRRVALTGNERRARLWLYAILGLTVLGVLSKGNGALIPLLILICASVVPTLPQEVAYRHTTRRLLTVPAVMVVAWLVWLALPASGGPALASRGWSIGQRLLTEPTVLIDYLSRLWLIQPVQGSVFHDQFAAAVDWRTPWYTLPCAIICIVAPLLAWRFLKSTPALSLAVLFYFGGQLMESTSVSLELYFEHRNYLPAMLMFWPAALAVGRLGTGARWTVGAGVIALLTGLTFAQATLWAHPVQQAIHWATLSSDSPRAQAYAAQEEAEAGQLSAGIARIRAASDRFADEPQVAFTLIDLACQAKTSNRADLDYAARSLKLAKRDPGVLLSQWLGDAIADLSDEPCQERDAHAIETLLDAAAENPRVNELPGRRQDVLHLRGLLALKQGDPRTAALWFDKALRESPDTAVALNEAAALGRAGYPELGLRHLDTLAGLPAMEKRPPGEGMPWLHKRILEKQGYWENEIRHLRRALESAKNRTAGQ